YPTHAAAADRYPLGRADRRAAGRHAAAGGPGFTPAVDWTYGRRRTHVPLVRRRDRGRRRQRLLRRRDVSRCLRARRPAVAAAAAPAPLGLTGLRLRRLQPGPRTGWRRPDGEAIEQLRGCVGEEQQR